MRPLYKGVISNIIVQLFVLKRYIVQILVSKILCLCYQRMMKFWLSLIKKWQSLDCFLEETMQLQAHIWNQLPCFNWLSLLALCYLTTLRWWLMHMVKKSIDLQILSFLSWEFQTFQGPKMLTQCQIRLEWLGVRFLSHVLKCWVNQCYAPAVVLALHILGIKLKSNAVWISSALCTAFNLSSCDWLIFYCMWLVVKTSVNMTRIVDILVAHHTVYVCQKKNKS